MLLIIIIIKLFNIFCLVTRVRSQGCVWIQFNVVFKDFHHYGFENDNNS